MGGDEVWLYEWACRCEIAKWHSDSSFMQTGDITKKKKKLESFESMAFAFKYIIYGRRSLSMVWHLTHLWTLPNMDSMFSQIDLTIGHRHSVLMREVYPKIYGLKEQREIWDSYGQDHFLGKGGRKRVWATYARFLLDGLAGMKVGSVTIKVGFQQHGFCLPMCLDFLVPKHLFLCSIIPIFRGINPCE